MTAKTSRSPESYPAAPGSSVVETAPGEELEGLQERRLLSLFRRTWEHVPFYRARWEREGIGPNDLRRLEDLRKLPVVSKDDLEADLRQHPPFGSYQGDFPAARVQASSGSSGNPKLFFHTRSDWEVIANLWCRRFHAQGVKEGDIFQMVFTMRVHSAREI